VPDHQLDPLLLRPGDVGRALGVSRAKVYALIAQGRIPGVVRATGSIRVSRVALEDWIAAETQGSIAVAQARTKR
jgi:excisionase family DNA binding protein